MLRDAGLNKTAVARRLKLHRQTVTKYWDGSVDEMTPPRYKARLTKVEPYREYITSRLEEYPELHAEALFHEIKTMGYDGSARTVRRFVAKIRPQKVREYKPVDALPGEQAQVDWGHVGTHVVNGVRRKLYVFVMTLSWSRAMYFEFVTSLNMATFAGSLHRALAFFKGVPKEVVFDNAKTVVADRVGDAVQFNSDLLHLALHYGFTPRACWIHDPESKGKVESNVKYVKKSFFYGRKFDGVNELNAQAQQWIEAVAHRRVHGTTFKHPGEELEKERPYMSPFVAGSGPSGIVEQRSVSKGLKSSTTAVSLRSISFCRVRAADESSRSTILTPPDNGALGACRCSLKRFVPRRQSTCKGLVAPPLGRCGNRSTRFWPCGRITRPLRSAPPCDGHLNSASLATGA